MPSAPDILTSAAARPRLQPTLSQDSRPSWLLVVDTCGRGGQVGCPAVLSTSYLDTRELLWDWPEEEEEVAALSWEKPLVQDSRLDMEPLKSSDASTS